MIFSDCHSAPINMLPTGTGDGSQMEMFCSECFEQCGEKDMSIVDCEKCKGEGRGAFSCCTGDLIKGDSPVCPKCDAVCGVTQCGECRGTGKVQINQD